MLCSNSTNSKIFLLIIKYDWIKDDPQFVSRSILNRENLNAVRNNSESNLYWKIQWQFVIRPYFAPAKNSIFLPNTYRTFHLFSHEYKFHFNQSRKGQIILIYFARLLDLRPRSRVKFLACLVIGFRSPSRKHLDCSRPVCRAVPSAGGLFEVWRSSRERLDFASPAPGWM